MKSAASKIHKVVFVRHGQSTWNLENRFTGWVDVDLTATGVQEATEAGKLLKEKGYDFDVAYTSTLQRAIKTYHNIAGELGCLWIPQQKTWRLNERHYGALQGLDKSETAAKHGEEQVLIWRRSYDIPPPELEMIDPRHPQFERMYRNLPIDVLPRTESLKTTVDRVLPFWYDTIAPDVLQGKNVIVVAHGNSLRAIVKHLSGMNEKEILAYNIPTACPLVFEFDEKLKPLKNYYLIDEKELKARQEAVANQGKKK
jgi:2,3-bisphosphoglycerate-dependent phosphoglycerate mutase